MRYFIGQQELLILSSKQSKK